MTHDDDELTGDERREFEQLARQLPVPAGLEDRVVADLRQRGLLTNRRSPVRTVAIAAAAALVLFLGGVVTGGLVVGDSEGERPAEMPAYLLLLYGGETTSAEREAARVAEYAGWGRRLAARGQLVAAERLSREAITFGPPPPVDTGGPVGFFLIRAATLDQARLTAAECPHVKYGGTVVIRPID